MVFVLHNLVIKEKNSVGCEVDYYDTLRKLLPKKLFAKKNTKKCLLKRHKQNDTQRVYY